MSSSLEGKRVGVPLVSWRQPCNPLDLLFEVMVGDLSSGDVMCPQQLKQIGWRPWGDNVVGIWPGRLAQSMVFLQLDHEVMGSNWATFVPFVPKSNGTSKALKLLPSKEQTSVVCKEGCSVFKKLMVPWTDFREVWNEPKNQDSRSDPWTHLLHFQKRQNRKTRSILSATRIRSPVPQSSQCMQFGRRRPRSGTGSQFPGFNFAMWQELI